MWVRQGCRVSVYITWAFSVLGSRSFYSAEHRFLLSRNAALFSIVFSSDDLLGCSYNIVTIPSLQLTFLVFVGRKRRHRPVAAQCLTILVLPALYVVRHDVSTFLLASIVSTSNRSYAFCLSCTGVHTGFCLRFRGRISNAYRDAGTLSMASLSRFRLLRPCERSRDGAIYYCR